MTSSFSQIPLDSEMAKSYRDNAKEHWMLNYFNFPEYPSVISGETDQRIRASCAAVLRIFKDITNQLCNDELELNGSPLLQSLDIPNHIGYWLKAFHDPKAELLWGRPDFHLRDQKPFLLETNFASAAGYQQQVSGLIKYYSEHPMFFDEFDSSDSHLNDPIVSLHKAICEKVKPGDVVLIPDVYEGGRHATQHLIPYGGLISWFNLHGDVRFVSSFIHDLKFKKDGVYFKNSKVDHVFMSYYNPHVFDRFDEFMPFWDLFREGKVNVLDSLNEVIWSNKLLFAFISEYLDDLNLNKNDISIWKETVPWTRIVREGKTSFLESSIDLERFIRQEKDRLVLKKAQSAEGKMVFIGKAVPQEAWDMTLSSVLQTGDWIVQEFIEPDLANITIPDDDDFSRMPVMETISPYMIGSDVVGYLNRYYQVDLNEDVRHSASVTRLNPVGTTAVQLGKMLQ